MRISKDQIQDINNQELSSHENDFGRLKDQLNNKGIQVDTILERLANFQVAIPSWALGTGATRFGRFPGGGEPASLHQKIEDIGILHALNNSSGAISLHIPWDIPSDPKSTRELAASLNIKFDAVNSNTFQDQPDAKHSYKFGSLSHVNKEIRAQAIAHNKEVINYGKALGSDALTVWLADGTTFPGQAN